MNIVVVEDSSAIRKLLLHHLVQIPGARVIGEATGEDEAVGLIKQLNPDVVLLDISLTQGSGVGVLQRVRQDGQACKVLVVTHLANDDTRAECAAFGADGFYDKASEIQVAMALIREWALNR